MINKHNHFIGEVRNINDPFKSGRVQIRIYGNHDDEHEIMDEHLPWALSLQPITSAATSKIGIIPTGMIVGSRVFGIFIDEAQQQPVILGTFSRGSKLLIDTPLTNEGGQEVLDPNQKGIDTPTHGHPEDNNAGVTPNATKVGGTAVDPSGAPYNNAPYVDNGTGPQGLEIAKSKFAPNSTEATISAVNPATDISSAIQQVGTSGTIMSNMVTSLNAVSTIMTMMNKTNSQNINTGVNQYSISALTAALSILSNTYGFFKVINLFSVAFSNNGFNNLENAYSTIVSEAITNFIDNGIQNNFINLPYNIIPPANITGTISPSPLISSPPDFYIQQYYVYTNDPYSGYIQWEGPQGDFVYTKRTLADPNYISADQAIIDIAQQEFVAAFTPFFLQNSLNIDDINYVLDNVIPNTSSNATNNSLGNNSSLNIMGLVSMLLGTIGSMINIANAFHIPSSVLNQSSINSTLQKFASNMSFLQQMKNKSAAAFSIPSSVSNLASLLTPNSLGISLTPIGGISVQSILTLMNMGIPQLLINSLNNLTLNKNLNSNTVNIISSITYELNSSNIPIADIIAIQNLLAEII